MALGCQFAQKLRRIISLDLKNVSLKMGQLSFSAKISGQEMIPVGGQVK